MPVLIILSSVIVGVVLLKRKSKKHAAVWKEVAEQCLNDFLNSPEAESFLNANPTQSHLKTPNIAEANYMDPKWDCDYRMAPIWNRRLSLQRGDRKYQRPFGWKRIALNVDKYGKSKSWLGSSQGPGHTRAHSDPGEWVVSFNGTGRQKLPDIIHDNCNPDEKKRVEFGEDIRSSPSASAAGEIFSKTFEVKGKTYKYIVQNRVDMNKTVFNENENCFITEDLFSIRPYGLLIKRAGKKSPSKTNDQRENLTIDGKTHL